MMSENACKSLRFSAMPVITTRFGRKRRTLLIECGLHTHTITTIIPEIAVSVIKARGHTDIYITLGSY